MYVHVCVCVCGEGKNMMAGMRDIDSSYYLYIFVLHSYYSILATVFVIVLFTVSLLS